MLKFSPTGQKVEFCTTQLPNHNNSSQVKATIENLDPGIEYLDISYDQFTKESKKELKGVNLRSIWSKGEEMDVVSCIEALPRTLCSIDLTPLVTEIKEDKILNFKKIFEQLNPSHQGIVFDFKINKKVPDDANSMAFSVYVIEQYLQKNEIFPPKMKCTISINDSVLSSLKSHYPNINLNGIHSTFEHCPSIMPELEIEPAKDLSGSTSNIRMHLSHKYTANFFDEKLITPQSKKRTHAAMSSSSTQPHPQLKLININSLASTTHADPSKIDIDDELTLYSCRTKPPITPENTANANEADIQNENLITR